MDAKTWTPRYVLATYLSSRVFFRTPRQFSSKFEKNIGKKKTRPKRLKYRRPRLQQAQAASEERPAATRATDHQARSHPASPRS